MKKLILVLGLFLFPWKEYEVICSKDEEFIGTIILARRDKKIRYDQVVTNIEYYYEGEHTQLIYNKNQLRKIKKRDKIK